MCEAHIVRWGAWLKENLFSGRRAYHHTSVSKRYYEGFVFVFFIVFKGSANWFFAKNRM